MADAAAWGGMKRSSGSNIMAQIKGDKVSAGKHPVTKEPLHWYLLGELEIKESRKKKIPGAKKVKNLDTGEVFDSINSASRFYSISSCIISKSCKSQGKIPVGSNKGPKFHWVFIVEENIKN